MNHTPPPRLFTFGAIILAAGASSRLGQPKQLLNYKGRTLVARAAEAALTAGASPVIIVLGAHADEIRSALSNLHLHLIENPAWPEGMGSSIRTGLAALETLAPTLDAALIALCDQPHLSADAIHQLAATLTEGKTIAATRYAHGAGVPALFARIHFPALRALSGAAGARQLIATHTDQVASVSLPDLALDIDTPADLSRLNAPK